MCIRDRSATIPVAEDTGNLTIRPNSIVSKIEFDSVTGRAVSVLAKDRVTGEFLEFNARVFFCNASTVGTTAILLNSRSDSFPNGLGNSSGVLGHNLMDHHYGMGAGGTIDLEEAGNSEEKPVGFYVPRFRNCNRTTERDDYLRGFGYQGSADRLDSVSRPYYQKSKRERSNPNSFLIHMECFGEFLPYHENRMFLNFDKLDPQGMPTIVFDAKLKDNELRMREDGVQSAIEMLEASGCTNVQSYNIETAPGACSHEMGTARMGADPKTSVLNKWNQMHDVPNVFVSDGSCMTSSGTQNPSLTYMALTARAVDYAHKQIKTRNL